MRRLVDLLQQGLQGQPEVKAVSVAAQYPVGQGMPPMRDALIVDMADGRTYSVVIWDIDPESLSRGGETPQ